MGFNKDNKETWWYVSDENMMLNHSIDGYIGLWSQGVHDSIEQTYHAYIAYEYKPFIDGIKNCWKKEEYENPIMKKIFGFKYKPQRYPIHYESMKGMSRDHVIYSLMAFYYSGMSKEEIFDYGKRLPFMIGDNVGTTMTLKLWLWIRLICGKKIGYFYYPLVLFTMIGMNIKNYLIEKLSGFNYAIGEEHQRNFKPLLSEDKPKIIKKLANLYYPTYAIKLTANMLNIIPENWFVKQSRKLALKYVPTYNYVLKMLLKQKLTNEEVSDLMGYKSMSGDRWSDQLNKWYSDRKLFILEVKFPDIGYTKDNELDKDYAFKLLEISKNMGVN